VMWGDALILIPLAGAPAPVSAQAPTPAQLEVFRNLPHDQQRAVLESMQQGGGSEFTGEASQSSDGALPTLQDSQSKNKGPQNPSRRVRELLEQLSVIAASIDAERRSALPLWTKVQLHRG